MHDPSNAFIIDEDVVVSGLPAGSNIEHLLTFGFNRIAGTLNAGARWLIFNFTFRERSVFF
ncbi:MAG: hypothetical protein R3C05_07535 [Pirellulaceae bacterium]